MKTSYMHRLSLFITVWSVYALWRYFEVFTVDGFLYQPNKIDFGYNGIWILASIIICLVFHGFTCILYIISMIAIKCSKNSPDAMILSTSSLRFKDVPELPDEKQTFAKSMKKISYIILSNAGISTTVQLILITISFSISVLYKYSMAKSEDQHYYLPLIDLMASLLMINVSSGFLFYDWVRKTAKKEKKEDDNTIDVEVVTPDESEEN